MNETVRNYRVEEKLNDGRVITIQYVANNADSSCEENSLSRSALYSKFLTPDRELNERELACFTDSDLFHQVALYAGIEDEGKIVPLGVARYLKNNAPDFSGGAELTIGVDDDWSEFGVEGMLLKHLICLAKKEGITSLTAEFPTEKPRFFDALRQIDQSVISVYASGVFSLLLPLADGA